MNPSHEPDSSHTDHAHDVSKHIRAYLIVGGALLVLTLVTVALSFVDFGSVKANFIVAMIVATFKAGMVAAIFMHLSSEKWTIYRFLILTVLFTISLFGLTGLAFWDPIRQ